MARYKERNDDIRVIGSDKVMDRYYAVLRRYCKVHNIRKSQEDLLMTSIVKSSCTPSELDVRTRRRKLLIDSVMGC